MDYRVIGYTKSARRISRRVKLAVYMSILLAGAGFAAPAASAQPADLARADLVEQLATQYAEIQSGIGLSAAGGLVEIFTARDGSTWTLVLTRPDGTSQIIAAGEFWIKR